MSEPFDYGVSGATSGATLAQALSSSAAAGPIGVAVGLVGGLIAGFSQRKKRKKAEREKRRLQRLQLFSQAGEVSRTQRQRASQERAMYAMGGLSLQSGSAAAVESGIIRESIYKQEAILAGLPGRKANIGMLA